MLTKTDALISVIIPVYNAEKTIARAVDSVLSEGDAATEIIMVDDGSSFECAALCDRIAEENPAVRVIHKENGGSLTARLAGAEAAAGEYILYLDADDVLYPGALSVIRRELDDGVDILLLDYTEEIIENGKVKRHKMLDLNTPTTFEGDGLREIYRAFMEERMNTVCATVYRKEAVGGASFPTLNSKLTHGEDRIQKLIWLVRARKIKYAPESVYCYFISDASQSSGARQGRFSTSRYLQTKEILAIEREYYPALLLTDEEVCRHDVTELERICRYLENEYLGKYPGFDLKASVEFLAGDDLFRHLTRAECLAKTRPHVRKTVGYISKRKYSGLKLYLKLCALVRKMKYGRKS